MTLNVQDLLLEAYRQIGDPDGVYGCGAGRLADPVSRSVKIQFSTMYNESTVWEFLINSLSPLSLSLSLSIEFITAIVLNARFSLQKDLAEPMHITVYFFVCIE